MNPNHTPPGTITTSRLSDSPFFAAPPPNTTTAPGTPTAVPPGVPTTPPPGEPSLTPGLTSRRPTVPADVDWAVVLELKRIVTDRLDQERRARLERLSDQDLEVLGEAIIGKVVDDHVEEAHRRGHLWSAQMVDAYRTAVRASQFGFGRLEALFQIPSAENITVNGCNSVVITHTDGRRERYAHPVADSNDELEEQLRQIGRNARPPRTLDATHTDMTVMVRDRFRIHAITGDLTPDPSVSIRQHHLVDVTLADLVERGMLTGELAAFLDAAVKANLTLIVAGAQGAGKTTLLRALINAIPVTERFGTLETDMELFAHRLPGRDNTLVLHSRTGMGEKAADGSQIGEIGVSSMVDMALRQGLQRIIVGEVRGAEASAMFQAMQVGAGTMCTTHSKNVESIPERLASRVAEGNVYTFDQALRQVGLCVDLLIHVELLDETWRGGQYSRFVSRVEACSTGELNSPNPLALKQIYVGGPPQQSSAVGALTPGHAYHDILARYGTHSGQGQQ